MNTKLGNSKDRKHRSVCAMERAGTDQLIVRSDLTIKVVVKDPLYRPIVHRYLDHLITNLRSALRNIDFNSIINVDPQVNSG